MAPWNCGRWRATASSVRTEVVNGGPMGDHKGINLPGRAGEHPFAHRKGPRGPAVRPGRPAWIWWRSPSCARPTTCANCATVWAGSRVAIVAKIEKPRGLGKHRDDSRRHRRRHGGARRSGRGDGAGAGAAHSEVDHPARAAQGPLCDYRHPDAGIHDRATPRPRAPR